MNISVPRQKKKEKGHAFYPPFAFPNQAHVLAAFSLHTPLVVNRVEQARALPDPVDTPCSIALKPSPPSVSMVPNRPFCVQPPEYVDQGQFDGYVFNVVLYPWSLRVPSSPDADAS